MAGRPGRGLVLLKVMVLPETLARLESGRGDRSRSEYARGLIEAGLSEVSAEPVVETPSQAKAVKSVPVVGSGDDATVLGSLSGRRATVRQLSQDLGWVELRVEKAVKRLGDRIEFHGGGLLSAREE